MNTGTLIRIATPLAALAALGFALVGFQPAAEKNGVVDLNSVMVQSDNGKKVQENLNKALEARRGLLDFISQYRVLTVEQAQRMRELWLKPNPTAAETAELNKIKSDVQASDKKLAELSQKTSLTDADRALLTDYSQRRQTMTNTLQRWSAEMDEELRQLQDQARGGVLERARTALKEVAKAQGYTTVFETSVAPYGANDLTEATIKAMNAKP